VDNVAVLSLLALAPILTIGVLLVGFRWPAIWAMPVGYVIIGVFVWQLSFASIAASTVQGLIIALTILYIVFGASLFQFTTAANIGLVGSAAVVVAAQAVGGAAGNMITVHNVVAASATCGLLGKEGALIRKTIIPMTYYVLLAGSITYIWIYGFGFNLGTIVLLALIGVLVALGVVGNRQTKPASAST